MKLKAAAEAGIKTTLVQLGTAQDGVGEQDVMAEVERLNADADVHGIIVQLPLSDEIGRDGERRITEAVSPEKDVDGCVQSPEREKPRAGSATDTRTADLRDGTRLLQLPCVQHRSPFVARV